MNRYEPDRWHLISIKNDNKKYIKVLSAWNEGHLFDSAWRLSSEIKNIEDKDTNYLITTDSGSTYVCYKDCEGIYGTMINILEEIKKSFVNVKLLNVEDFYKGKER